MMGRPISRTYRDYHSNMLPNPQSAPGTLAFIALATLLTGAVVGLLTV